ncbi:threonine kinase [Roseivivax marinus]|uniref:hypothetical protein n=1 Tax=Roseivivax marinus TaxID=1379903 RepID=UPI0008C6CECC|nr:hypothetical protein [Roseivivax marinus]SEL88487.1 threonine kinase [Roseivivax marinus]
MIRVAGHFGEWLQGRLGADGPVALVTMACPALSVRLERIGDGSFSLEQSTRILAPSHLACLWRQSKRPEGRFRLRADMPPGGGAGASTAALIALTRAAGMPKSGIAALCLSVEGATDPLMLEAPDAVLWASREARALEALPPPPRARIVGGFFGPPCPTDAADHDFPDISDLMKDWRTAPNLVAAARLASVSAQRCTALRGPADDPMPELAATTGALGHVRAHTGSARGLVFAPGSDTRAAEHAMAEAGATGLVTFETGGRP